MSGPAEKITLGICLEKLEVGSREQKCLPGEASIQDRSDSLLYGAMQTCILCSGPVL